MDGSPSFLKHLGPFGCIETAILSKTPNVVNLGFINFFIPRLTQPKRCKNIEFSEFSTPSCMSVMCGKLKKMIFV